MADSFSKKEGNKKKLRKNKTKHLEEKIEK